MVGIVESLTFQDMFLPEEYVDHGCRGLKARGISRSIDMRIILGRLAAGFQPNAFERSS